MEEARIALTNVVKHEMCYILLLLLVVLIGILFPGRSESKRKASLIYCSVAVILLVFLVMFSTAPLLRDYYTENIIVAKGLYSNPQIRDHSTKLGRNVYTVTVMVDGERLRLTTPPGCKEVFIYGEHEAIVYYLPNAKRLLHMELA